MQIKVITAKHTAPCVTHQIFEYGLYSIEIMKCWSSKHNAPAWGVDIHFMGWPVTHGLFLNRADALASLVEYCDQTFGKHLLDDIAEYADNVSKSPLNASYEFGASLQ